MAVPTLTPEEISEILAQFFDVVGKRQYIGARYVPIFGRKNETSIAWDNSAPYEPLTIVLYQGNSYTSRQYVPAGVDITNTDYWANTGNYNAQVEQYRQEVANIQTTIEEEMQDLQEDVGEQLTQFIDDARTIVDNVGSVIPTSSFSDSNTVLDYMETMRVYNSGSLLFDSETLWEDVYQFTVTQNLQSMCMDRSNHKLYILEAGTSLKISCIDMVTWTVESTQTIQGLSIHANASSYYNDYIYTCDLDTSHTYKIHFSDGAYTVRTAPFNVRSIGFTTDAEYAILEDYDTTDIAIYRRGINQSVRYEQVSRLNTLHQRTNRNQVIIFGDNGAFIACANGSRPANTFGGYAQSNIDLYTFQNYSGRIIAAWASELQGLAYDNPYLYAVDNNGTIKRINVITMLPSTSHITTPSSVRATPNQKILYVKNTALGNYVSIKSSNYGFEIPERVMLNYEVDADSLPATIDVIWVTGRYNIPQKLTGFTNANFNNQRVTAFNIPIVSSSYGIVNVEMIYVLNSDKRTLELLYHRIIRYASVNDVFQKLEENATLTVGDSYDHEENVSRITTMYDTLQWPNLNVSLSLYTIISNAEFIPSYSDNLAPMENGVPILL